MVKKINPAKFALRLFNRAKQFFFNSSRSKYLTIGLVIFVLSVGIFGIMRPAQAGLGETLAKMAGWILMPIITLLGQLLLMVINLLIGVAQYNDFINATAVIKGWVIVRDVCNMFFIILLLYVAFCLVLGIESRNPKKTLVNVLIMAILINFSRMICGLIIDFAQVIMMTFVNAFKDAAAGNITTGLGLQEMLKFRNGAPPEATANPSELVVAMLLGIALLIIALVVMTIIMLVLVIRIVVLWILVLLSPLAFMASLVPFGKKWSSEWWSKFTNQVIVGPVLAFFLWLALSLIAAQPGEAGLSQEFKSHGAKPPTSVTTEVGAGGVVGGGGTSPLTVGISEIGQSDRLLSFAIAIVLLVFSLITAQQMGVYGGKMAGAVAGKIQTTGAKPFKKMGERVKGSYERNIKGRGKELRGALAGKLMGTKLGQKFFPAKMATRWAGAGRKAKIERGKKQAEFQNLDFASNKELKTLAQKKSRGAYGLEVIKRVADKGLVKDLDSETATKNIKLMQQNGKEGTKEYKEYQKYHFGNSAFKKEESEEGAEMLMRDREAFSKVPVERMNEGFARVVSKVAKRKPKMAGKLVEVLEKNQIAALNKSNKSNLGKAMGDDLTNLLKAEGKSDTDINKIKDGIRNGAKAKDLGFIDTEDEAAMAAASPTEKNKAKLFKKYSDEAEAARKWGRIINKGKKESLDYYKKLDDKGEVVKGSVVGDPDMINPNKSGYGTYAADLKEDMGKITKPEDIKKLDVGVKKEGLRFVNANIMLKGYADGKIDRDTLKEYLESSLDAEHNYDMNFPKKKGQSQYTKNLSRLLDSDYGAEFSTMINEINSSSDRVFKTRSVTDKILENPAVYAKTGDNKKKEVKRLIDTEKYNKAITVPAIEEQYGPGNSPEKDKAYDEWSTEQADKIVEREKEEKKAFSTTVHSTANNVFNAQGGRAAILSDLTQPQANRASTFNPILNNIETEIAATGITGDELKEIQDKINELRDTLNNPNPATAAKFDKKFADFVVSIPE